jgi:hypothetical protein
VISLLEKAGVNTEKLQKLTSAEETPAKKDKKATEVKPSKETVTLVEAVDKVTVETQVSGAVEVKEQTVSPTKTAEKSSPEVAKEQEKPKPFFGKPTEKAQPQATQHAQPQATQHAQPHATQHAQPHATQHAQPHATRHAQPTKAGSALVDFMKHAVFDDNAKGDEQLPATAASGKTPQKVS